jgi:hypothetical protein
MHNASIVEHDIHTSPFIQALYYSLDVGLLRDVALHGGDFAAHGRSKLLGFGHRFLEGWFGDVCHQDRGTFAKEENGRLEPNATVNMISMVDLMRLECLRHEKRMNSRYGSIGKRVCH